MHCIVNRDDQNLIERINKQPELRTRIEEILNIVENTSSNLIKADEAEKQTIEEVRKLGSEIMHSWANNRVEVSTEQLHSENANLRNKGKRSVKWHTTFGDIKVEEPVFSKDGHLYRPFSHSSGVTGRHCSLPLQRAIVDFGADHAFGKAPKKLKEHYGIEISPSTIATITEGHANQMFPIANEKKEVPNHDGCKVQIGEIDGSMIPIVTVNEESKDKRKNKKLSWKEAKLSIVHQQGSVTPRFGAVFSGSVDDAGQSLLNAAIMCGFGKETYMHSVGDGAKWIALQIDNKFGNQGHYLIDMCHMTDYLYDAATVCASDSKDKWVEEQKELLKTNQYKTILNNLKPHIEADDLDDDEAPVRKCYRYIDNRPKHLDYKYAIDHDLPIGSGEVESAHRYVIQQRLKLAGAWWTDKNADAMLALRIIRANDMWDNYWDSMGIAA